ncbi:MAG: glutamine--fructose-6-phosphate transaminase (isomerizing) [bacterium JZ-2024 1]
MCGIIGYCGSEEALPYLREGLKRLEYRGYDSVGFAVLKEHTISVVRKKGKIKEIEEDIKGITLPGTVGIGHTRWATHGEPSEKNAHPHKGKTVALVHNGIIENYLALREFLLTHHFTFSSETDSEVMVHLVDYYLDHNLNLLEAVRKAAQMLEGTYAFGIISSRYPDTLIGLRRGSPLVVGYAEHGNFIASDIPAFLPFTRRATPLDEGDIVLLEKGSCKIFDENGKLKNPSVFYVPWDPITAEKSGYRYFMEKEIYEQPRAVADTLRERVTLSPPSLNLDTLSPELLLSTHLVQIIACGTSYHAGLVGKYLLEELAGIPTMVEVASEFRSRKVALPPHSLLIAISQSGETADTLACVKMAKEKNIPILAITNTLGNSLTRLADEVLYTRAGLEIGVAATKTYTSQILVLLLLALFWGKIRKTLSEEEIEHYLQHVRQLPRLMEDILSPAYTSEIEKLAYRYAKKQNSLYLGRGIHYPTAMEGALKLKEISYIHAEAYAGGEMKHGPIALIDSELPVVVIAPFDAQFPKILGNIREVQARRGEVLLFTSIDAPEVSDCASVLKLPPVLPFLYPMTMILPLQLFAYHIALIRGYDVDQPRNLAKTVTVE